MDEDIRWVHEEAVKPESFYARKPLEWFLGRCVKMAFQSAESIVEHMWVRVTNVEGANLIGELDNDPVLVTHVKCGDRVVLSRVQIEAVDLTFEEWKAEVERLRAQGDYFNRWLGYPGINSGLKSLFDCGFTPRQALVWWRGWLPQNGLDDGKLEQER